LNELHRGTLSLGVQQSREPPDFFLAPGSCLCALHALEICVALFDRPTDIREPLPHRVPLLIEAPGYRGERWRLPFHEHGLQFLEELDGASVTVLCVPLQDRGTELRETPTQRAAVDKT